MRIAIDARELAGRPTGVGRYLAEILREWGSLPDAQQHEYVLCAPEPTDYQGPLRVSAANEPGSGTLWEQRMLPRLVREAAADVLFCPGYTGPVFDSTPLVVAIHDVSFAAHPEWFGWREGLRRRLVTRAAARRAQRVLTLTEFSRREVVEHLGVAPDRVEVVYPGVTTDLATDLAGPKPRPTRSENGQPLSPLLLYVGSVFNRRHVPETVKGFERLARRRPDARFTIVGDNRTFPRIDLPGLIRDSDRVRLESYVPDDTLADLYGRARAFVFLSEYEGFGLTPLEALARGVPIVVLDTEVAREAYGDAAVYVSAPDPRRIERALELALFDEEERSRVLTEGPAILARYSWATCAAQVLDALVNVW